MSTSLRFIVFTGLSVMACGGSASADALRCQSVNGNLNCAGSSGASCQTIDGRTVCVSGHGDVVQSFGNATSRDQSGDAAGRADQPGSLKMPSGPAIKEQLERYQHHRQELLEQAEAKMQFRADRSSSDRD